MARCPAGSLSIAEASSREIPQQQGKNRAIAHLVAALKACAKSRDLEMGREIHRKAVKIDTVANPFVASSLIQMYAKCGSMTEASSVFFREIPSQCRDVVSWTALMLGFVDSGQGELALELFVEMIRQTSCWPDAQAFVAAIKACSTIAARNAKNSAKLMECLEIGMALHSLAAKDGHVTSNLFVGNALIDMYARCGSMVNAKNVFHSMPRRDVVSWTSLLVGLAESSDGGDEALGLFERLVESRGYEPDARSFVAVLKAVANLAAKEEGGGERFGTGRICCLERAMALHSEAARRDCVDIFVANTLVDVYAKCRSLAMAKNVFERLTRPSLVSWNTMILACAENDDPGEALRLFSHLDRPPDVPTFVAALKACAGLSRREGATHLSSGEVARVQSLEKTMALHALAVSKRIDSHTSIASSLVAVYAECGSLEDALRNFGRSTEKTLASSTALLRGLAKHGQGEAALDVFFRMAEPRDPCSFVAALKACSSLATMEAGKAIHGEISKRGFDSRPMVATSLVDFYGKCGNMVQAQVVFDSIGSASMDSMTWSALIAGYSRQGDWERVFSLMDEDMIQEQGLEPSGVTFLSVLAACSHVGNVDKGKRYFKAMSEKYGITPGMDHYHCLVDLLGRANKLDEAVEMIRGMPFEADVVTWTTLLAACNKWKNSAVGNLAFQELVRLDEKKAAAYLLMAGIDAGSEEKSSTGKIELSPKFSEAQSWDEDGGVHRFGAGDPENAKLVTGSKTTGKTPMFTAKITEDCPDTVKGWLWRVK